MCVAAAIAGAGVVGGVASGVIGADASKSAANTQADAANRAADMQWQQFQQMQQNLQPYMNLGTSTIPQLQALLGSGQLSPNLSPFNFNMTQQQLEQTPGYQFTLQQGLKGVNNAAAAKGLGLSGAQLKGISDYTTGLADQTFQQQYQNALNTYLTNQNTSLKNYGIQTDQYSRLAGLLGLGQNAAAGVGNAGLQTASNAGGALMGGANAQAAGQIGAANAYSSGLGSLGSGVGLYSLLRQTPFSSGSGGFNANDPNTYFNDPTAYG